MRKETKKVVIATRRGDSRRLLAMTTSQFCENPLAKNNCRVMGTENSVLDGAKLTDEQLGKLQRKLGEIKKRIDEGGLSYQEVIDVMQNIIIENRSTEHLGVIRKTHEIKPIEHAVDCGGTPYTPDGWSIESNKKGGVVKLEKRADGQLYIDGKKVVLFRSKKQLNGKTMVGHKLREEVSGKEILNAIILDYLLAHPELIPENWKKDEEGNTIYIFFWGTIYRRSGGSLFVRCLFWLGSQWNWRCSWLDVVFGGVNPAALLAS